MYLYELAIDLGEHSSDLAEVATMLGVVDAGPGSNLDAQQVAQLRAHFGGAPAGPPPPPLPLPGNGAPPPSTGGSGPATWGPPAPPQAWGPPGTPTFESVPGPPLGSPVPETPEPGPLQGSPVPDGSRWSKGQLGALAGVAVVVIGLFGFMVLNTGPDEERQQALEAREQELAAATTEWVPPPEVSTTTAAPPVTAAPMPRAVPRGLSGEVEIDPDSTSPLPDNATLFCSGFNAVLELDDPGAAALDAGDLDRFREVIANKRAVWDLGVEHLLGGASERDRPLVEIYRDMYVVIFDLAPTATSVNFFVDALEARWGSDFDLSMDPVNQTAAEYCY